MDIDVDQQFFVVDKTLLLTFQWSNEEYEQHAGAAQAFLHRLHEVGWDVTISNPELAARYDIFRNVPDH